MLLTIDCRSVCVLENSNSFILHVNIHMCIVNEFVHLETLCFSFHQTSEMLSCSIDAEKNEKFSQNLTKN